MADDLSQTLALLRGQRHGFMNHLQVISGWLQMGKHDRAMQYISRVAARLEAEGELLRRVESPAAALFVLAADQEAESHGVVIEWEVTGPVDSADLSSAQERLSAELTAASALPEGARRIMVTLGRTISVHRPSVQGEG